MRRAKTTDGNIYRLKVTLKGSKPPIWRRIEVPADVSLDHLHLILQVAMGWYNSHLHAFRIGGAEYGDTRMDVGGDLEFEDERRAKLSSLVSVEKANFTYEYDFGDGWEHVILVEAILPREAGVTYPRCVTGKRACPPEDVGGIWGYANMLEALADPEHPEHKEYTRWLTGSFDPEAFDLQAVNEALHPPRGRAFFR